MAPQPDHSIIAELEDAVRTGTPAERVETLRQVTNLFLHDGARLSEEQVKIFDDVMCLLIARVESRARAEFGKRHGADRLRAAGSGPASGMGR